MTSVLERLLSLDQDALEATQAIRWAPLTAVFVLASAWWFKACAFASVAALIDARARRFFPATLIGAALVAVLAELSTAGLKESFDRTRPPEAEALITLPSSSSFPSGHALMSFAAAAFLGALHPRLRAPLYGLAAAIAVSRTYLGVHYWLDIAAGAALGIAFGLACGWVVSRLRLLPGAALESPRA